MKRPARRSGGSSRGGSPYKVKRHSFPRSSFSKSTAKSALKSGVKSRLKSTLKSKAHKHSQSSSSLKGKNNGNSIRGKSIFVDLPSIRATTADASRNHVSSPGMSDKLLQHELGSSMPGPRRSSSGPKGVNAHRWIFCDNEKLEKLIAHQVERTIGHYMKLVINSTQEIYVEHRTNIALMLEKVNNALKDVDDTKVAMTECNKAMNEMISNLVNYKKMDKFIQNDLPSKQVLKGLKQMVDTHSSMISGGASGYLVSPKGSAHKKGPRQMPLWKEGNLRAASELHLSPKEREVKRQNQTMNLYKMYGKKTQKIAPVLTYVSMMSTNSFGFGTRTATVPNDMVIFKLSASVPIHSPRIKLWPNKSDTNLHRFKVDCMDIEGTRYLWIATCKLSKDSPTGKMTFVIQFDSINNVPGVSVNKTTDGSSVKVVRALTLPEIKIRGFSSGQKHRGGHPKKKRKKSRKKSRKCDNYADHLIREGRNSLVL